LFDFDLPKLQSVMKPKFSIRTALSSLTAPHEHAPKVEAEHSRPAN